jgi:uncharacterized protein
MISPYLINVLELMRRPGTRKAVVFTAPVAGLTVGDVTLAEGTELSLDLVLESLSDGISVVGRITAPWNAECRRCLGDASGVAVANVREMFQKTPTSEDIYEFDGEQMDLAPMSREAVVFELPIAPLCSADCAGLCPECGANRNEGDCGHNDAPMDPRWAGLSGLAGLKLADEIDD